MTKKELISKIFEEGLAETKNEAGVLVEKFIKIIEDGIINNDPLSIKGFGKFEIIDTKERVGRNPQTGEEVKIPAGKKIKFVAFDDLKNKIK